MNEYARLSEFKRLIGASAPGVPGGDVDQRLLATIEQVSREFDRETGGNWMYARSMTRYVHCPRISDPREIFVPPFVSLSSVGYRTSESESYTALTVDTDYWLEPQDKPENEPYRRLRLTESGALRCWPMGTDTRSVRLIGVFGYSDQVVSTGATVQNTTQIAADGTTLTVGANHGIDVGEVLKIESEYVYAKAVPSASTTGLTIERGVNGTTPAAHANGVTIYRRVYPADVVQGVLERARSLWNVEYRGGGNANDFIDSSQFGRELYPRWRATIRAYRLAGAVI